MPTMGNMITRGRMPTMGNMITRGRMPTMGNISLAALQTKRMEFSGLSDPSGGLSALQTKRMDFSRLSDPSWRTANSTNDAHGFHWPDRPLV